MYKSKIFINSVQTGYEKVLSGEKKTFSPYFFEAEHRKDTVIILLRYLIEEKLKISPKAALNVLTNDLLSQYKLTILLKYVNIPPEYKGEEAKYLVYYAYKGTSKSLPEPSQKELTIYLYKKILNGELKTFPKNYFLDGLNGEKKVQICLEYLCNEVLHIEKKDYPKILTIELLQQYKLKIVLSVIYSSIFDMLNSLYPDDFKIK